MEDDCTVTVNSYTPEATTAVALPPTIWTSIVFTLTNMDYADLTGIYFSYLRLMINDIVEMSFAIIPEDRYAYNALNIVRLGGPPTILGIIANVEIYSPGSNFMTAGKN